MTATASVWSTSARRLSQWGRCAVAFQPSQRYGLLLGFLLLWAQLIRVAPDDASTQRICSDAQVGGRSHGARAQRLRGEEQPWGSLQNAQHIQRSSVNAAAPRLLSSASTSIPDARSGTDGGAGGAPLGSGGSGAYPDGADLTAPSPPPPTHRHPEHLVCSYDRVTAPEPGGGCGLNRAVVEFAVVVSTETAGAAEGSGEGDGAAGNRSSAGRVGGGGGTVNATRMCANPAAYSSETGTLAMSLCWRPGDLPDLLLSSAAVAAAAVNASSTGGAAAAAVVLRVTLLDLTLYGISSMAPGNYSLTVDGADAFGAVVQPADSAAAADMGADGESPSAPVTVIVPAGGAASMTFWFDLRACDGAAGANATAVAANGTTDGTSKSVNDSSSNSTASVNGSLSTGSGTESNSSSDGTAAGTGGCNGNGSCYGIDKGAGSGNVNNGNNSCGNTSNSNNKDSSIARGVDAYGPGNSGDPLPTASRVLSFSLAGPPNPPPAATTCKCAATATAAAAVVAAAAGPAGWSSVCAVGMVPLVATILPAPAAIGNGLTDNANGTNGTSGAAVAAPGSASAAAAAADKDDGDGGGIGGGGGGPRFAQCVPQPVYDKASRQFAFSMCWRFACMPAAFARRPYELLLGPVSYTAATAPPGGSYKMSVSLPYGVNMSYEYTTNMTAATGGGSGAWTTLAAAAAGASSSAGGDGAGGGMVRLPYLAGGQARIRIQIPFNMNVDDSGGSLELRLISSSATSSNSGSSSGTGTASSNSGGGAGSSRGSGGSVVLQAADGSAVTPPPLPSAAAANANATLTAVSELWLTRRVSGSGSGGGGSSGGAQSSVSELADMIRRGMEAEAAASSGRAANFSVSVALVGYRLTLPLQFRDFSSVPDCGTESLATLSAAAAAALAVDGNTTTATVLSVGCSYGAYSGGRRRRLQQQTCTPRINTPIAVDTSAVDLNSFLSYSTASLSTTYDGSMCSLDPASPEIQITSKLAVSVAMPASAVVTSTTGGAAAAASASACTAGAQVLAASLGLSSGEAMVVGCQLSALAPPDAVPQAGPETTPAPLPGGNGGGGSGSGDGGGRSGDGGGARRTIIIIAAGAGAAALAAAVLVAVLVRRRRRRSRSSRFLSSEASTGQRTFDSISTMSIDETVKALAAGSTDSAARMAGGATPPPPPFPDAKRRRRSFEGPDSGSAVASIGVNDLGGVLQSSSKSLEPSSRARGLSYTCKTGSPRPSVYGSEPTGGAAAGIEAGFLAVVPPPAVAAAAAGAAAAPRPRRSTNGGVAGGAERRLHSSCPDRVFRRGAFNWVRVGHPGCTNDSDDEAAADGGGGGGCSDSTSAANGGLFGAAENAVPRGLRMSDNGGAAARDWYDFFGLDDGFAAGADLVAGVNSGGPPGSGGGGSGGGACCGAVPPSGLAARRRSSDSGGRRCSAHALRRSNGGNLAIDSALPPPSPSPCESDGDAADGGRRMAAAVRTSVPLDRHTAPASMALASPRSPLSPISPRNAVQGRTLRPLHLNLGLRSGLPGIAEWQLPGGSDGWDGGGGGRAEGLDLPYGFGPIAAAAAVAGGNLTAPGHLGPNEDDERDLLRVQSRRPAFLDRTGGSLAAAVAATVSVSYSDGADGAATAASGVGGVGGIAPRSTPRDASTRVEPRRGGFIRRSSVAPYNTGSEPSSYSSYVGIRSNAAGGSPMAAAVGAPGACYEAWSPAGSPGPSPRSSLAATLAGVIGGRRRSSGCGSAVGPSRLSCSGAAGTDEDCRRVTQDGPGRPPSPVAPPPSPSSAAAAPQWMGGLSRRAKSKYASESAADGVACLGGCDDERRPGAAHGSGRGGGGGPCFDSELSYSPSKVRQPPRMQGSGGLDPYQGLFPDSSSGYSSSCGGACGGAGAGAGAGAGGGSSCGSGGEAAYTGHAGGGSAPRPMGHWPSPGRSPLAPKRMPALLLQLPAADDDGEETRGSVGSRPATTTISMSRFAADGCKTAPVAVPAGRSRHMYGSPNGSTSGADGGSASASGERALEELSPAFGPTAEMRARQLVKRSSSCGSSNGAVPYGMGGLVDPDVEAGAESGAARLAMMKRLAVGPPRPAWGLIHAGVGPIKRSIASVQYVKSLNTRAASPAARAAVGAASPSAAAAASSLSPAALAAATGPRSSVPGRLLSGSSSRDGSGVMSSRASSRETSGPFLRLVE